MKEQVNSVISPTLNKQDILDDYKLAYISRQCSILARKEVLSGKAKFGIFGDGKEVAQLALARTFLPGDWRSGYYRDQTFLFATGISGPEEFFAQLYGDTDLKRNPGNAGRSFNNHFSTRFLDEKGNWKSQIDVPNTAADLSPTAGQMPRLIGLAYASKLYRNLPELKNNKLFSKNGNEVAFGTIGDASTAEGHFFETINAAAVLQIPLAMSVWDDGYGISVTKDLQIVKSSISEALKGFEKQENSNGIRIYRAKGWDYPEMLKVFSEGIARCRKEHIPVLFHIEELTQPLGHSTSGSHERYKSTERLEWEKEFDAILKMKKWILDEKIASEQELERLEEEAFNYTREVQRIAWKNFQAPIKKEKEDFLKIVAKLSKLLT